MKPFNHYDLEGCTYSPQGMCTPHFGNGVRNGEIILLLRTPLRNWCSTYRGAWAEKICIDGHVFNEQVSKLVNLRQSVFPHCCLLAKLYIPSTLNIVLILWHIHTIECVCNKINAGLNHGLFISFLKLILCLMH